MIRRTQVRLALPILLALAALALFPVATFAAPSWESIGPSGHDGYQLFPTSNPKILYATTFYAGLYRSDDQGASWREVSLFQFSSLAVDPRDPDRLVACACRGSFREIFRSDDGGTTFQLAQEGLLYLDMRPSVSKFVHDPDRPDVVYAASEFGLFRSVRRAPWELIGFPGQDVHQLAIDSRRPRRWIAAVVDPGPDFQGPPVFKVQSSDDGGVTWSETPGTIERNAVDRLLFDSVRPDRLYAVSNCRLYRFGAAGWERLGPAALPLACSLAESSSGQLLAPSFEGILLSDDGGVTWTRSPAPKDVYFRVESPAGRPATLIASGNRGLWRSTDDGRTWKPSSRAISGFVVGDIAVAADGTLFASPGGEGVMRSRDQGETWERIVRGFGPESFSTPVLTVDPRHPEIVWAGANELYESTDGGDTWQSRSLPDRVDGRFVHRIWVDPHKNGVVVVKTLVPSGGGTLQPFTYATTDGGRTWRRFGRFYRGLNLLAFVPGAAGEMYVVASDGLYFSRDDGATWRKRNIISGPHSIAIDPHDSATIWLGTYSEGVLRSTNGGTTFSRLEGGEPLFYTVDPIVFDPSDPKHPYLTNQITGVFRWSGPRNGWVRVGEPNPRFDAKANGPLAIDPERRILYAGTSTAGIYRLRLGDR